MSYDSSRPLLNSRHERFAVAAASGHGALDCCAAGGFSLKHYSKTANRIRSRPEVQKRILRLQEEAARTTLVVESVHKAEVLGKLRDVYAMAMKGTPVTAKDGSVVQVDDGNGGTEDLRRPDLTAAKGAADSLGKTIGMFVDVQREENFDEALDGMGQSEVEILLKSLLEQLDPNMRKKFAPMLEEKPALEAEVVEDEPAEIEATVLQ